MVTLLHVALAVSTALFQAPEGSCIEDRESLLALDQQAFDQDLVGGWRPIAQRDGCRLAAAELIREYRERALAAGSTVEDVHILFWHEGQLRAFEGQRREAGELFRRSFSESSSRSWVLYAQASIAYLEGDREAAESARAALSELPVPEGWAEEAAAVRKEHGFEMKWPPNLDVVDGMLRCFDKPYSEAYGSACRTP